MAVTQNQRIEFRSGVPDKLFRRANGRCSVPRCTRPTMGPYPEHAGAANLGNACHIYSAAQNGPRGWGDKDEVFIGGEENGLWCCAYHANLIDKNLGRDYSVEMLFAWKALAEARTLKQMNDMPSPLGWVDQIELIQFPYAKRLPQLVLSRFTLLAGVEASGKTVLLEMASGVSHSESLDRFIIRESQVSESGNRAVSAKVTYSTVDTIDKQVEIQVEGYLIKRIEKGSFSLLPPGDIEVVYCADRSPKRLSYEDDLDFVMRVLKVDKSAAYALIKVVDSELAPGEIHLRPAEEGDDESIVRPRRKEDGERYIELFVRKPISGFEITLGGLSTSEQRRVLLALQVAKARETSKQRLTLLLIDELSSNFDTGNFSRLLNVVARQPFQAIVCVPNVCYRYVIDENGSGPSLRTDDYLGPWRLQWLGSPLQPDDPE